MKQFIKTLFVPFFISSCCCSVLFLSVSFVALPKRKSAAPARLPYEQAEYEKQSVALLVHTDELRLIFLIRIHPGEQTVSVTCIPENAVINSSRHFDTLQLKKSGQLFFGTVIDRSIQMSNAALSEITDCIGGIDINTPYGLPALDGRETLTRDEVVHVYGYAALSLLGGEAQPDATRLTYYAEMICRITAGFLDGLSDKRYTQLRELTDTDISYTDYYNFAPRCTEPLNNLRYGTLRGVWMNADYCILDNSGT